MAVPQTTVWAIEPHTEIKHVILRCYLNAWLPMMSRYNGRIVFIDGFAGPGRYRDGEPGSPIIAVTALLDHNYFQIPRGEREFVFLFVERDEDRAKTLRGELRHLADSRNFPTWMRYDVKHGEFEPVMTSLLDALDNKGGNLAPSFVFVDPFGFAGVPMQLIARIMSNPKCECLVTFMFNAVNHWVSHPDPKIRAHSDSLFGDPGWRALITTTDPQQRHDSILDLYRRQLETAAGIKYVRTFEMLNARGRPIYSLFFGTNNALGLGRMKEAMWKADPGGGCVFSDRTVSSQTVLFQASPDLTVLRTMLQDRFRGRGWVLIDEVIDFVRVDTPFAERKHLKRQALGQMERARPRLIRVHRPKGSRQRAGDYPSGTRLMFL